MIQLCDVYKHYLVEDKVVTGLNGINLEINSNGLILITGKSGSGKTTLLNILSFKDNITSGSYFFKDKDIDLIKPDELDNISRKSFGVISQDFSFFDNETVEQNIEYASVLFEKDPKKRKKLIRDILNELSISNLRHKLVRGLSGGEKQRVAIARALIKSPDVIIADEITSNLDEKNSKTILELLYKISKEHIVIVVTHDEKLFKKYADRKIVLSNGKITQDNIINKNKDLVKENESVFNSKSTFFGLFKNISYMFLLFLFSFVSLFVPLSIYDATNANTNSSQDTYFSPTFNYISKDRNVIIKNDLTAFNDEDYEYFQNLEGFKNLINQDILLDTKLIVKDEMQSNTKSGASIRPLKEIKKLTKGAMPSNDYEIVTNDSNLSVNPQSYISLNDKDYYEIKQVGAYNYNNAFLDYGRIIYVGDKLFRQLYADYTREFYNHILKWDEEIVETKNVYLSDKVEKGTVVATNKVFENKIINLSIENSNHINEINNLKVIVDNERTIIDKTINYVDVLVLNKDEYIDTVNKNFTQISVFIDNKIESTNKYNVFYPYTNTPRPTVTTILLNILFTLLFIVLVALLIFVTLMITNKISTKEINNYITLRNIGYSNKQNLIRLIFRHLIPIIASTLLNIGLFLLFKTLANYAVVTSNETLGSIFIGALSYQQIIMIPIIFIIVLSFILLNNVINKYKTQMINRNKK